MSDKQKLIAIFDANSLIHRAWHALPPLTDPQGRLVNAVYGFFSMFLNTLNKFRPDFVAVAFDEKAPTFRKKLDENYKKGRVKPPQEFYDQFAIIKTTLADFAIPFFSQKGYEADDIIATIAKRHLPKDLKAVIISNDKDVYQLLDKNITALASAKSFNQTSEVTADDVKEKFGFAPQAIVDFKALRGDPSDNIAGVGGVGEKTATLLLSKYKTLANIYRHLDEIQPPRLQKLLKQDKKQAFLAYKLAKAHTKVPIKFNLKKTRLNDFDQNILKKTFLSLGFNSLIKKLPNSNRKSPQQLNLL